MIEDGLSFRRAVGSVVILGGKKEDE